MQAVEGSSAEPDKRWRADVNSTESIEGSSSEWYEASLFLPPFTYSQGPPLALLFCKPFCFAQHFLPITVFRGSAPGLILHDGEAFLFAEFEKHKIIILGEI